jgi:hypothetical protein
MEKQSQLKLEYKLFAGHRNPAPDTCERVMGGFNDGIY